MSLVRDKYWIDPKGLDAERAELRSSLFRAMAREVVAGVDGRATVVALREAARAEDGGDPEECLARVDETADFLASELPGKFTVVTESWQGRDRSDFHAFATYIDGDTVCLLYAGQEIGDGDPHVDSIWISMAEFRAMADLALAAAHGAS